MAYTVCTKVYLWRIQCAKTIGTTYATVIVRSKTGEGGSEL